MPFSSNEECFQLLKLYVRVVDSIHNIQRREEAQDGFEYLLVSGAVATAVVAAIVLGINNAAIKTITDAVVANVIAVL